MTITRMFAGQVNCGPVAMQIATGRSYNDIIDNWSGTWRGVSNDRGLLGLPNDAPMDHFATLEALNVPYQQVKCDDILNGNFTPEKTVLLLHLVEKPSNIIDRILNFFRGTLHQHWVTLIGKSGDDFLIDWGYYKAGDVPDIRAKTRSELELLLRTGWPYCAYEVGKGNEKQSAFKKFLAKFI